MKYLLRIAAMLALLVPSVAAAQFYIPCTDLPGCGSGPKDLTPTVVTTVVSVLLQVITSAALGYIIYAGIQTLFSQGDDGKADKARWGIVYALGGLGLAITSGTIISLVGSQTWGTGDPFGPTGIVSTGITAAVRLFNVAFAIVVVLAGYRMVTAQGKSDEFNKALAAVKYAIMGAIMVNIAKALVQAFLLLNLNG
ncbi:MAG: hypothetical protein JWM56_806 [Candidatus Peribacteria bacterium]|nr:hypothetical protein [Candidatus Peribacteria bacterium]